MKSRTERPNVPAELHGLDQPLTQPTSLCFKTHLLAHSLTPWELSDQPLAKNPSRLTLIMQQTLDAFALRASTAQRPLDDRPTEGAASWCATAPGRMAGRFSHHVPGPGEHGVNVRVRERPVHLGAPPADEHT